jgi:hypothetical protein
MTWLLSDRQVSFASVQLAGSVKTPLRSAPARCRVPSRCRRRGSVALAALPEAPPLKEQHRRKERLVFNVTKVELEKIKAAAEKANAPTISDYIRDKLGL